jgi:hypothetical protein
MKRTAIVPVVILLIVCLLGGLALWSGRALAVSGSYPLIVNEPRPISVQEAKQLERYLRHVLSQPQLRLVHAAQEVEVLIGEQFLGWVYPEDSREGRAFYFEMSVFTEELDEFPPPRRYR